MSSFLKRAFDALLDSLLRMMWPAALGVVGTVATALYANLVGIPPNLLFGLIGAALALFTVTMIGIVFSTLAARAEDLSKFVYVGRVQVSIAHLWNDHYIEFTVFAFNGARRPISVERHLEGATRYSSAHTKGSGTDRGPLPTPQMVGNANLIPPGREFTFTLEQRIPSDLMGALTMDLNSKDSRCHFLLTGLNITLLVEGSRKRHRLQLWDGVACHLVADTILVSRIVHFPAHTTVLRPASHP